MSSIRRIAPKQCPDCKATGSLFIDHDKRLTCRNCGYKQGLVRTKLQPLRQTKAEPTPRYSVSYSTPNSPDLSAWEKTKYFTALEHVEREEYDEALTVLKTLVNDNPEVIDAHLWIARLSEDPDEKRHHYGLIIAEMPNQLEAIRELMVLNGQLSRQEADRTLDSSEPEVVELQHAVQAKLVEIVCSSCGGTLTANPGQTEVHCQFCGHVEQVKTQQDFGIKSVTMALLKERGQEVQWKVGKFLLHCDNCGSERIITSRQMTGKCPFCGSSHVVKTDALQSLMQPDGIVRFEINKEEALEAIEKDLKSFGARLKSMFVDQRVRSIEVTPVYLPYWMFDVTMMVTRTVTRRSENNMEFTPIVERQEFMDGLNNVPWCGTDSPSPKLTSKLRNFDVSKPIPYDPKRLANLTALIYTKDFQKSSIEVRKEIGERIRLKHGQDASNQEVKVSVSYIVQNMMFRLMLLPVWVGTVYEMDGDERTVLVHGQRGQVVMDKARKPVE